MAHNEHIGNLYAYLSGGSTVKRGISLEGVLLSKEQIPLFEGVNDCFFWEFGRHDLHDE